MNEIATLIRYAGREVTQSIHDVCERQLRENVHLDEDETKHLKDIAEDCRLWLVE